MDNSNNSAFTVTALINMITCVTCRVLNLHLISNKKIFEQNVYFSQNYERSVCFDALFKFVDDYFHYRLVVAARPSFIQPVNTSPTQADVCSP